MSQYLLASHVYLCVTDDHVVLLDLKRDKYLGVSRGQMKALATCVKGWPAAEQQDAPTLTLPRETGEGKESLTPSPVSRGRAGVGADSFVSKMLDTGMLTGDASNGKEALPIAMPRPQITLTALDLAGAKDLFDMRPVITPGHIINFMRATFVARAVLKWRPIAAVVAKVGARKARRNAARVLDFDVARKHVAAFVYLRPLLFTTKDKCLADSLALVNFLAYYRVFPAWVFGVQTGPFAAHCWVQAGEVVFNDTPDHVRRYTPILAV